MTEIPWSDRLDADFTLENIVDKCGFGKVLGKCVVITGLISAADALEMMLLSIIGPVLQCEWQLTSTSIAYITTSVFIGFLIGAPLWGYFADRYGRWPTILTVMLLAFYFGILTSLAPTLIWVIILRFFNGCAIGGASTSYALIMEYTPTKYRSRVTIILQAFWATASLLTVGISFVAIPRIGWRWLLVIASIPAALSAMLLKFLPESIRYLAVSGQRKKAEKLLIELAKQSNVELPTGKFILPAREKITIKHMFTTLFSRLYIRTTIALPFLWIGAGFTYFGAVLLPSTIFRFYHKCYNPDTSFFGYPTAGDPSCCRSLATEDYILMLCSGVGEFLVIPLSSFSVDIIGRRWTLALFYGLMAILYLILIACMPKVLTTLLLFVIRALSTGIITVCYLYTSEVYPTTLRQFSVGLFSSVSRIGAILTPFVAQVVLPDVSAAAAFIIYSVVSLICALVCFMLDIETKDRVLQSVTL